MTTIRSDGDSWDLASSVGATATMVAAARAMASRPECGLIDDPFAEPLVRAVGIPFFIEMLDGRVDSSAFGDDGAARAEAMIAGMAMRTRFFDDYFTASMASGIRQAVILASGLDSRAYRLPWPADTVIYEIDQPAVIEFKTATLADMGARPSATRMTVGIDLRGDWPAALTAAGFDPARPTAWLAEGLLIYLPPPAQDRLIDTITELSSPGSAVATEYVPGIMDFDSGRAAEMSARMRERGLNLDMPALVYSGPRSNVMNYLREAGWQVTGVPRTDLFTQAGLQPPDRGTDDPLGEIVYVSANR
ncbi:MAG: class I SAM-dependent methyltransferase [Mycobacterium sp.]|nr:class I SAM-dependent methyltransferase [Mycobacterium sp.]